MDPTGENDTDTERATSPLRLKLLVVDDEPLILRSYHRMLADGHDLTEALGGKEAIEQLMRTEGDFDVILCDLSMPDVDGIEVYQHALHHLPGVEQRIVFATGGLVGARFSDFVAEAEKPCLEKPFARTDLDRIIDEVLARVGASQHR